MSRDAPPPLPGGYKAGEKVFYTGPSQTLQPGYDVVHGQQGEVTGPATGEATKGKGVTVLYPGNKGDVACLITLVRRLRVAFAATPRLRPTHATLPKPPARPHPTLPQRCLCPGAPTPNCKRSRRTAHRPEKHFWAVGRARCSWVHGGSSTT